MNLLKNPHDAQASAFLNAKGRTIAEVILSLATTSTPEIPHIFIDVAKDLNLEWKQYYGFYHEDGFYCCHNRSAYELAGCKFSPIEVAAEFSHETMVAENYGKIPFGFHGRNNYYYQVTQKSL